MTEVSDFEAWYRDERPRLVRAMWAISGDVDQSADIVDEAFSRALARWGRVSSMESRTGWVRTVAVNLHRRAMRRRAVEERLLRRQRSTVEPAAVVPDLELWTAVASLPPRQREVIVLRYVADYTEAAIAAALSISEGAVSASLAKARRQLAATITPTEEARAT